MPDSDTPATLDLTNQISLLKRKLLPQDKDALSVAVLSDELKVRWQQLSGWDAQIDRWMASYGIAIVIGISWLLGSDRVKTIAQFLADRNNDNSYFVLALALVNASYIVYMTFKGYQIQQVRLYVHEKICQPLNELTGGNANTFEQWLRPNGETEWRRKFFYAVITVPPFFVSVCLLLSYYIYICNNLPRLDPHNLFFDFVIFVQACALAFSLSTTGQNWDWKNLLEKTKAVKSTSEPDQEKVTTPPVQLNPNELGDAVATTLNTNTTAALSARKTSAARSKSIGFLLAASVVIAACAAAVSTKDSTSGDRG